MFKVIIAGGRDFKDYQLLRSECNFALTLKKDNDIEIVSGKQVTTDHSTGEKFGADYLGEKYAEERGYKVAEFPADWVSLGKGAGHIRNKQMAEYADALIAFWDGKSRGTKSMIDLAKKNGLQVKIVRYV